jgi:ferredoxin
VGAARAGVAVCEDLASFGLDPDAVSGRLRERGIAAEVVRGPCARAGMVGGWERTVFAVCPDGPSGDEIRSRARRAGADPGVGAARVDAVEASAYGPREGRDERAATVLGARLAGLVAAPPSPAEGFRMAPPSGRVSRRSLLSFGGVRYVPVAAVGHGSCRGSAACGLCVDACPVGAIGRGGAVPQVDRDACIGCGACVTACPVEGAASLPGADLERFRAELGDLLGRSDGSGLLVRCAGAPPPAEGSLVGAWLPIEVPCLSIVTAAWALAALAAGARAIAFRGCGGACGAGSADRVGSIVSFVRETLELAGSEDVADRVRLLLPEDDGESAGTDPAGLSPLANGSRAPELREPAASAWALATLGAVEGRAAGTGAPFGRVVFEPDGCTMCGLCAAVCPTEAIRFEQGAIVASLDLDRSACVGCGHCAAICPEGVLSIERGVDLGELGGPRDTLKRSAIARCRRCGEPVAPSAMLQRLRPLLDHAVLAVTEDLCQRCRALG